MQILNFDEKPIHRIQFLNAAKRGGVVSQVLSIVKIKVDTLPAGLEAILVTGDLQGVVQVWQSNSTRLLGEELANEYGSLAEKALVPKPENTGVILAGDFYSAPDGAKRGASGDVRIVWETFAKDFKWVAGVQGNHDRFGTELEETNLKSHPRINLLDYDLVTLDDLIIGGVSGVIGDPVKPARKTEEDFLSSIQLVLESNPDLLVLHHGPTGEGGQRGSSEIRQVIERNPPPLTICGHVHWDESLATLNKTSQILNVDNRAFVLTI